MGRTVISGEFPASKREHPVLGEKQGRGQVAAAGVYQQFLGDNVEFVDLPCEHTLQCPADEICGEGGVAAEALLALVAVAFLAGFRKKYHY